MSVADYVLRVESLDPDVVAFAPMVASHHPRVIAVGEGKYNNIWSFLFSCSLYLIKISLQEMESYCV